MTDTLYVGIDVAKGSFDVASDPAGLRLSLPQDPTGRQTLLDVLQAHSVALIVLEATGGYELVVVAALVNAGLPVVVANPRQVRDFARATGRQLDDGRTTMGNQAHNRPVPLKRPRPSGASAC